MANKASAKGRDLRCGVFCLVDYDRGYPDIRGRKRSRNTPGIIKYKILDNTPPCTAVDGTATAAIDQLTGAGTARYGNLTAPTEAPEFTEVPKVGGGCFHDIGTGAGLLGDGSSGGAIQFRCSCSSCGHS